MKQALSSKEKSLSSLVLRVSSQSRMKKMLRLIRGYLICKRNSKKKSRSMMQSQHPARKVSRSLKMVKRSRSQPSIMRNVKVVNANLGHLKHLKKPKKTVTMALSKSMIRGVVAKAEKVAAEAEAAVEVSIREREKSNTKPEVALAPTRMMRTRPLPHLSKILNLQLSLKRKSQLRYLSLTRSLMDGVTLHSSDGNHFTNLHDQALVL
jgi:hypothetical protein